MPVLEMLEGTRGRAWLHMPGHGGRLPWLEGALDLTELSVTDDLNDPVPGGPFERAQALAARACGAGATLFLTGGSTLGIQAMLLACVRPGGKVILPRDAHRAAISGCALGGLQPVYVWPRDVDGRAALHSGDVLAAMREHPDAQAVYITRPDYYGACIDILPIARAARGAGMCLLTDEAHGAHFAYGGEIPSAGALGADAWVQSAHKTLPAMTPGAYLHAREPGDRQNLAAKIALLGTSSPSFLVAASLDYARAVMQENGKRWIEEAIERNDALLFRVKRLGFSDGNAPMREAGFACDRTRIVLDVRGAGLSGYEAMERLSAAGVDVEMADFARIVALPPLCGGGETDALERALEGIAAKGSAPRRDIPPAALPRLAQAISPREAALGGAEPLPREMCAGRIAARAVGLYPPGIPLAMPGERLDRDFLLGFEEALRAGGRPFGLSQDGSLFVVREET